MDNESTNGLGAEDIGKREVDLRDYLFLLWKRKWLIIPVALLGMLYGALSDLDKVPVYVAQATLQIEMSASGGGPGLEQALGGPRLSSQETQIELIRSRTMAENLVKALKFQFEPVSQQSFWEKVWSRMPARLAKPLQRPHYTIEPLEIGEVERTEQFWIIFLDQSRFQVVDGREATITEGRVGQPVQLRTVKFRVEGPGMPGHKTAFRVLTLRDAAQVVQGSVKAIPVRNTEMMRIQGESTSPARARDLANALSQEYISLVHSRKTRGNFQTMEFIREQIQPALENMNRAELELRQFKQAKGSVALSEHSEAFLTQVGETQREIKKLQLTRQELEQALEALRRSSQVEERIDWLLLGKQEVGGIVSTILTDLSNLRLRRAVLRTQVTELHPALRQLDDQVQKLKEQLVVELSASLDSFRHREEALKTNFEKDLASLANLPVSEQQFARLMMQVKINQDTYNFLLRKQEELRLVSASQIANVWIVDHALIPLAPVSSGSGRSYLMTGGVGLLVAIVLVIFWERYVDKSLKTADDVTALVRVPFLGSVPLFKTDPTNNSQLSKLIILNEPFSHPVEAFRYIWTNLLFASFDRPRKSMLITSTNMAEGKTTVTANLAVTIAQTGKRVLLVDADLRRAWLHQIFGLPRSPGFSNYLAGEDAPVHESGITNLSIMTGGDRPPNPVALLGSPAVEQFLMQMGERYDLILFDTPPLQPAADAVVLGSYVEGAVLLVRSRHTTGKSVVDAMENLRRIDSKILGVVLNAVDESRSAYHKYYYEDDGSGRPSGIVRRLRKKRVPVAVEKK